MSKIFGTDVSFYEDDPETIKHIDYIKMQESGAKFTYVRAGQNTWVDPDFFLNWRRTKEAGMPRGAYWFYDSRVSPQVQAGLWASTMKGDFGELPLCCDLEDSYAGTYKGGGNYKAFVEEVQRLMPGHEIMIYTGFYWWKDNVSITYHPFFAQFPLWIAAYNNVAPMIPMPWKTWLFWQFSETGDGNTFGTEGQVDLDWYNGDLENFQKRFNISTDSPPTVNNDIHIDTNPGITCHILNRFGTKCIVHVVDPKLVEVHVTGDGFSTVADAVRKYGSAAGFNGGGWPNLQTPDQRSNEVWVSEGVYKQLKAVDDRGFINVSEYGKAEIRTNDSDISNLFSACGFDRILGEKGVFNPRISDHVTKDARTGTGITADGKVVFLSVEGNDRFQVGMTFREMWDTLVEFGAIIAGNNDGGSSSACWNVAVDPKKSLIVPSDGSEANVINQVLLFATGAVKPPENNTGDSTMAPIYLGICKVDKLNLKDQVSSTVLATLQPGWEVEGVKSPTGSDLMDITFYRKGHGLPNISLNGKKAKASITGLTTTLILAPIPTPDPEVPPPAADEIIYTYVIEALDPKTGKKKGASGILKDIP